MRIELGKITKVGDARVAALTGCEVDGHNFGGAVVSHGQKVPLAVLVWCAGDARAFHLTGEDMSMDELERLCPGAWGVMQEEEAQANL